jgi:hypothetical protein
MFVQGFAVAVYVLSRYMPQVVAARAGLRSASLTTDGVASGTTASCLYECGAREVTVDWDAYDASNGTSRSLSSSFTIGVGQDIKYKPTPSECLSRCQLLAVSSKASCDSLHRGSVKVSKSPGYKLCCVPRTCNYIPASHYERHEQGDQYWQIRPFQPLRPITGLSVPARTCLCCDTDREQMEWDSRIKSHCLVGHTTTSTGNLIKESVRLLTIKTSDVILRARCRSYCSNYPDHPYGMRSREERSLLAYNARPMKT